MSSILDPDIAAYYSRTAEELRLQHGPFQLEEVRTRELIGRYISAEPQTVLDVGGAAGAYAFWLAELGHVVHLVDAVPRLVDEANRRNTKAEAKLMSCRVGDARAIPFEDNSADVVLMLGPLYHLVNDGDRVQAIHEAARVLVPGGLLIAAGISRWASTLDGLVRELLDDPAFRDIAERDIKDGQHRNPTDRTDYFTTAYFHRADDLRAEIERAPFVICGLFGIEGPGWLLSDFQDRWEDPQRRESILYAARALESAPDVIGCSAHLLAVARRSP